MAVPKENFPGENRVALTPESVTRLVGNEVLIESGAGNGAGYDDQQYAEAGAHVVKETETIYAESDIILKVNPPDLTEVGMFRKGVTIISFLYPLINLDVVKSLAIHNVNAFAMDLVPRISRAQSMDALSSQSNIAGYKAVLLAADRSQKVFPMMMTAAGTIPPAKVFVIGAGVAGLQAIATARRLGAVVQAYDVRPAVQEQVESLGARFIKIQLESKDSETIGGYAKNLSPEFYQEQQKLMKEYARLSDVIITTALVVGRKAPILLNEDAVKSMKPGSVIVDLAAEQGGNCALTEPGKIITKHGVTIIGLTNIPSLMAQESSAMYSRNITSFLLSIAKNGIIQFDMNDLIVSSSLVTYSGEIVNVSVRSAMEDKN